MVIKDGKEQGEGKKGELGSRTVSSFLLRIFFHFFCFFFSWLFSHSLHLPFHSFSVLLTCCRFFPKLYFLFPSFFLSFLRVSFQFCMLSFLYMRFLSFLRLREFIDITMTGSQ